VSATPHPIYVIATTEEGTRAALAEAKQLSAQYKSGRIVLLVPQVASDGSPSNPSREAALDGDSYRELASRVGVDAKVRLCVGRRLPDIFRSIVSRNSVVVVGRRRWWWPTAAQRIAGHLGKQGHQVVFADISEAVGETA
jgi:hypothetical protein